MSHGGARPGAGRKKMTDAVPVCWRISRKANGWIRRQAKEQGVSVGAIVDELVKTFEEVSKGYIVMQKDYSKITLDLKGMEEGMSHLDKNGYIFSHPREVLETLCRK